MYKKNGFELKLKFSAFCHKFRIISNDKSFCGKCSFGLTFNSTKISEKILSPFQKFLCEKCSPSNWGSRDPRNPKVGLGKIGIL